MIRSTSVARVKKATTVIRPPQRGAAEHGEAGHQPAGDNAAPYLPGVTPRSSQPACRATPAGS